MKLPWQDFDKKQQRALTITVIVALVFGAYFLRRYFLLIVVAAMLAYLFNPINQRLLKKGRKKGTAAVMTFTFMLVVLLIPITLIMVATVAQTRSIIHSLGNVGSYDLGVFGQNTLNAINRTLSELGAPTISQQQAQQAITSAIQSVGKALVDVLTGTIASIPDLITRAILFIYVFLGIMVHQDSLLETLQRLNPLGRKVGTMYLNRAGAMTKAMAKGQLIIAFCDGLTDATLMYIAGFQNIFFFMLILLTFLSFIPLGGGIIVIPLGIIMILLGHVWQGLLLVLGHILITSNIDNVLRPRFVPKDAYLQPALTMLSVFSGVAMFGFLGVIVGPIIMILIVSTIEVYLASNRSHDHTPAE